MNLQQDEDSKLQSHDQFQMLQLTVVLDAVVHNSQLPYQLYRHPSSSMFFFPTYKSFHHRNQPRCTLHFDQRNWLL